MARLFDVEPELLLSNILVFQIPMKPEKSQFNISLAGNLDYEKKIETSAINCMHLQTTRVLEALLEKIKNSTTDVINGVLNSYELSKVLEKLQKDI